MAEFTYNPVQTVADNVNVILNTSIGCNKGYVFHRNDSGIVILRGIVNCPQATFARYQVTFNGNIAIPTDPAGTVDPISIALAIDGEPLLTSQAIVTPAAAGDYFNVTSTAFVTVPRGCCFTVAVENTSGQAIDVQNSNLVVQRVA